MLFMLRAKKLIITTVNTMVTEPNIMHDLHHITMLPFLKFHMPLNYECSII